MQWRVTFKRPPSPFCAESLDPTANFIAAHTSPDGLLTVVPPKAGQSEHP
jgi:hypothetical protein